ncbi:MAG: hypothetical protein KDK01_17535, partial [Rhodobacteraceae bacterium]|nr:hypothetical protein [Paracoccaceae bacterium]
IDRKAETVVPLARWGGGGAERAGTSAGNAGNKTLSFSITPLYLASVGYRFFTGLRQTAGINKEPA